MKKLRSNILLLLAALIWGSSFTAQSVGVEYVEPFTFNGIRFIIGGLVLIPVVIVSDSLRRRSTGSYALTVSQDPVNATGKQDIFTKVSLISSPYLRTVLSGVICGCILFIASSLQQAGIVYTSAGKSGFITALYVILVPIISLFLGKRSTPLLWISAVLAVIGMYLLCISESMTIGRGELLTLLCAVGFSFHILAIDKLAPYVDGVKLSSIQFLTAGVLCLIGMTLTEHPVMGNILQAGIAILYAGVLSCGVAYTLQVVAQKNTNPVLASVLLSLESVFSVIVAWLVLGDHLSTKELIGCCITFAAVILAQLPEDVLKHDPPKNRSKRNKGTPRKQYKGELV